jgi:hypothetical protein
MPGKCALIYSYRIFIVCSVTGLTDVFYALINKICENKIKYVHFHQSQKGEAALLLSA